MSSLHKFLDPLQVDLNFLLKSNENFKVKVTWNEFYGKKLVNWWTEVPVCMLITLKWLIWYLIF